MQGANKEKVENFEGWVFGLYIVPNSSYDSPTEIEINNEILFEKEYIEENGELKLNKSFLHKRTIPLSTLLSAEIPQSEVLKKFLLNGEGIILIKITPSDSSEIVLPIDFRYGLSSEMATFNIHAAGFNSAIADN